MMTVLLVSPLILLLIIAIRVTQRRIQEERRTCPHCGSTVQACDNFRQQGGIACCPECYHKKMIEED